jgi:hypothetical protein
VQRRQVVRVLAVTTAAVLLPREPVWPPLFGGHAGRRARRGDARRSRSVGRTAAEAAAAAARVATPRTR